MSRSRTSCIALTLSVVAASCRTGPDPHESPAPRLVVTGEVAHELDLDAAALAKFPRVSAEVEERGRPETVEGIVLADLLRLAGVPLGDGLRGKSLALFVVAEAADGFQAVFALAEFDASLTDRRILVVDRKDGAALADGEGPLRVVVPLEKRHARWVRQVVRIVVCRYGRAP